MLKKDIVLATITNNPTLLLSLRVRSIVKAVSRSNRYFVSTVVVVESDLRRKNCGIWMRLLEGIDVTRIKLGNLQKQIAVREERLAFARNAYLRELSQKKGVFATIVFDSDQGYFGRTDFETSLDTLKSSSAISAISGGRLNKIYDFHALRCADYQEDYRAQSQKLVKRGHSKFCALRTSLSLPSKLNACLDNGHKVGVTSSFNGLAVYGNSVLSKSEYSSYLVGGLPQCEHVNFHQSLAAKGVDLTIDPSLKYWTFNKHLLMVAALRMSPNLCRFLECETSRIPKKLRKSN